MREPLPFAYHTTKDTVVILAKLFVLHEISVLIELTLGHLRYQTPNLTLSSVRIDRSKSDLLKGGRLRFSSASPKSLGFAWAVFQAGKLSFLYSSVSVG